MAVLLPQEIIRKKRDGGTLDEAEIAALVTGIAGGGFSEAQIAAFAMAVFFRGMKRAERIALTKAMRDSGTVLSWDLPGPVLDKHSTGGVGDKVSLVLAPIVAACGGYVPMISGRGLGHTGGTFDKVSAIPGYESQPDLARLRRVVKEAGCAIIGQTADLAPADRRFYAIRDVTGTVESIPLICASILSKKLAAGLDGLVMDVKTGAGDFLTGTAREARLHSVTLALAGEMLLLGGLAASAEEGRAKALAALESGRAAERFARMVAGLGGPGDFLERSAAYLAPAPVVRRFTASCDGILTRLDARVAGVTVVELGGGRRATADVIDFRVGFSEIRPVGTALRKGDPILKVHAADEAAAMRALAALEKIVEIADAPALPRPLIAQRVA